MEVFALQKSPCITECTGFCVFDARGKDRRGGKTSGRTNAERSYSGTFSEERRPLLSRAFPHPLFLHRVRQRAGQTICPFFAKPDRSFGTSHPIVRISERKRRSRPMRSMRRIRPFPRRSPASAKQARARPEPRPRVRPHPNRTGLNSCDQYLLARSAFPALSAARTTDSFCLPVSAGLAARASVSLAARTAARPASSGTFGETTSERRALPAFP